MNPEAWLNKVVTFHPIGTCPHGVPKPKTCAVGVVIAAKPIPPTQRGNIPDIEVTVRGRSGRDAILSVVENYCASFSTWAEAIKASEKT